ncbi:ribonuclease H-like domain-containing protein [Gigaspora rosea]|uniref:Ribonuclease H-like domain-containing protein n=1 Tax=Gigaspora rosea TaxID=44941 RepID=A0A397U3X1_9GLOM|nr:ribonuclease H-like domain-containing protein [Gigaspora rosea]
MGKLPYCLSDFIIVLEEKANKSNKYCVCRECISGSSYAEAEKHKFANTQELQKYSESEQQEILEKPDKSILVTTIQEESNNNSKASSSKSSTASVRKNVIDRYCLRPLNEDQQKHFEQLILKATVSCGWAFSWVENSEVKALFQFIHPLIKLPSRKNLSGQILAESAQKITESTKEIAKNDKNGCRTENMLGDLKTEQIKVNAVVTDCASEYEAARKRLRRLYPEVVFIPYFAYQMNLCVGDIFKNSNLFSVVAEQAIRLNSHYLCFASIIKSRAALKNLATKIEEENDDTLKDFPRNILLNISDNKCFGWVCQVIKDILNEELKDYLLTKLEKRWSAWEQPLLLLSFLLHPNYHTTQFNQSIDDLSFAHMRRWIIHYYKSWFGKSPRSILCELQLYENGDYPFNIETFNQFGGDVLQYWNFYKGMAIELHLVAIRIFSICITTASVERLFSAMGWYHSLRQIVRCVNDWKVLVERWVSLAEEEEDDFMQCDSYSLNKSEISTDLYDEAMLQDNIHPADNLAAKWKLADIFVSSLVQPASINLLLGNKV